MSEPGADVPLSLDGDALLAAVDLSAVLPWSVLLDVVALAAAEPLEVCVSSVINDGAARVPGAVVDPAAHGFSRGRARARAQGKASQAGQPPSTLDGGTAGLWQRMLEGGAMFHRHASVEAGVCCASRPRAR